VPYKRLIARLDIKGETVIKGIQMDGLRQVGSIREFSRKYYEQGVDEIVIIDVVASLYGRDAMAQIIRDVTSECFVPVIVGGGIRSIEDADLLFRAGADKVAINTGALREPNLITKISEKYGSQAVVLSIQAKSSEQYGWECYAESGREPSGVSVYDWIREVESLGAGELLVSSVDRDGTRRGIDSELVKVCRAGVSVPVIAASGVGGEPDVIHAFRATDCEGVASASALHYGFMSVQSLRGHCIAAGINVRGVPN